MMKMLDHFDKFSHQASTLGVSAELRQKAFEYLSQHGLPTRKNEDWKYTSLKSLEEQSFVPAQEAAKTEPTLDESIQKEIRAKSHSSFINLVFHNGVFVQSLSANTKAVHGFEFQAVQADTAISEQAIAFRDSFDALNTAYQTSHYFIEVAANTSIPKPIHFMFFTSASDGNAVMVHPKITVQVGTGSSVKFVESYFGEKETAYFLNPSVHVVTGKSSKVVFVRLQSDSEKAINIGRTTFDVGPHGHLHSLVFSTGAKLSRHNLDLVLKNEDISAVVDGVYLARGEQHVDNATMINHAIGGCNTSQHYKGILADQSRAVFNGKVKISQGAQKANSAQLNNNLLLSKSAEADSKPQLEVYADDVKASHGSTVGQLNREELFYLESRAISPEVAIPMLSFGYASELIYKIEDTELQSWLNTRLKEAFAGLTLGAV